MKRFTMSICNCAAILLMFVLSANIALGADAVNDYRTAATGDWNNIAIWERCSVAGNPGTWVPAVAFPTSAANIITIRNTHTATVTANVTVDQVVVNAGGQITVNSGITFTVANGAGTDLTVSGTVQVDGTITGPNLVVINNGGTVNVTGTFNVTAGNPALTVNAGGNLNLSGTGSISIASVSNLSVYGTVTMSGSSFISTTRGNGGYTVAIFNGGVIDMSGTSNISINGNANALMDVLNGGTLAIGPNSTVTGIGDFWLCNGATIKIGSVNGISASGTNTGNILVTGGTRVYGGYNDAHTLQASNTATFDYNGTAAQVTGNGLPGTLAGNLTIANPSGVSLTNNLTENGTLTVNPGGQLIVPVLKNLTVNGTLTNNGGNSGLLIKSDATGSGSLLHGTASVPGTVERYLAGSEWHQISSPISNAVSNMFFGKYLQKWENCNWAFITATNTPLTPMRGYAFYDASNFTAQYQGLLNEGTIGSANDLPAEPNCCGLHVVGNPYPSSIDWYAASGWTKTNLNDAVYIHVNSSTWATFIGGVGTNGGTRNIALGQGFIVFSTNINNPSTLVMNDNVRLHSAATFFKEEVTNIIRLEVSGGNNYQDETVIRFLPEATNGFDGSWDAVKILGDVSEAPQIYSIIPDQGMCTNQLSINALPETQPVPVGMKTSAQGSYTIKATEINGLDGIRLEDKTNGTFTDLAVTPYTFTFEPGQNDSRFVLHFYPLGVDNPKAELAEIYSYDGTLKVNMKENGNLYVYNMIGQLIISVPVETGMNKLTLSAITGSYIVKIVTSNNSMVKKVFVK